MDEMRRDMDGGARLSGRFQLPCTGYTMQGCVYCGGYFLKVTSISTGVFRFENTRVWPEKVTGTDGVTFTVAIDRFWSCRRQRCISFGTRRNGGLRLMCICPSL